MTVKITKPEFNLREKITELDKPTGLKGLDLMRSDTTQDARDNISAGRKNYIINGDFQISQRADYTSATTAANQVYYLDRWTVDVSGVSATIQQKTNQHIGDLSGNSYYKNTVTALAYDDTKNILHAGTSSGRSEFQGLNRINNTTTAVPTEISASDGLVAAQ